MGVSFHLFSVANRAGKRNLTGNALSHQNISGVQICVQKVVDQEHVEKAEQAQVGNCGIEGSVMSEIVIQGDALLEGLYEKTRCGEIQYGFWKGKLIVILCVRKCEEITRKFSRKWTRFTASVRKSNCCLITFVNSLDASRGDK